MDSTNYGLWGDEPISQPNKNLVKYGFTPLGGIQEKWNTGLSIKVLQKLADTSGIETKDYQFSNEYGVEIHRAYNIPQMRTAIDALVKSATKVTACYYESPMIDQRFKMGIKSSVTSVISVMSVMIITAFLELTPSTPNQTDVSVTSVTSVISVTSIERCEEREREVNKVNIIGKGLC